MKKKSLFYIRQEKIFPAKANWLKKNSDAIEELISERGKIQ